MSMPFPGMDPYLEHPVLWDGIHSRLIVAMANQLQPLLDPRYVASVEERVFILDLYNNMKLVTVVELLSPTNKSPAPGRESYLAKQHEVLSGDCHLVEIDLLREGEHALAVPLWRAVAEQPYDYLACVSRWPTRKRFELYPRRLPQRLPRMAVPLADPDPDVRLDLQAALAQVYDDGRYARRIRYDEACRPRLPDPDQQWATSLLEAAGYVG